MVRLSLSVYPLPPAEHVLGDLVDYGCELDRWENDGGSTDGVKEFVK